MHSCNTGTEILPEGGAAEAYKIAAHTALPLHGVSRGRFATADSPCVLTVERLAGVRRSFTTRRVSMPDKMLLIQDNVEPRTGDLVLANVTAIGQHTRLELPEGRRSQLYVGDEIIVAYGHRYAPDQFEAEAPADLGECHLVAAGGIASRLLSKNTKIKTPTRI